MRPLIISYYFPPVGGAGAQRPANFVRHLRALGHDPVVITGPGRRIGRWTPEDETLGENVPSDVEIRRAEGEPTPAATWRRRLERWLEVKSRWSRWWVEQSLAHGLSVRRPDVIFAVMSPFVSAEAAARLSRTLNRPWIADLGDPWALDEMMTYPTGIHRRLEIARMRKLLGTAAAIVTTTAEAAKAIRERLPELAARPIVSVPCGFDAGDFARPVRERLDDAFRIVHTGYLHTELGLQQRRRSYLRRLLGGGVRGVDILTRSHVYLLQSVERLIAREPSLRSRIEVHLAGVLTSSDRQVAETSPAVRLLGYLPHRETIELMRSADLLFLPMQRLPAGVRSTIVPGKTYEYLAAQRPILAAVPEGDARDILLQAGTAHICDPDDIEAMAEIVRGRLEGGMPFQGASADFLERFEYGRLTAHVAEVMEHVISERPWRPGELAAERASVFPSPSPVPERTRSGSLR